MKFTDIFIRRPVLSTVVSCLIVVLGLAGFAKMELRQYPKMSNTVITVTTTYPGANAETTRGFVTIPLQRSIASAEGIDQLTSMSLNGVSTITAKIKLNFDPDKALSEITGKVNAVLSELPEGIYSPVIAKKTGVDFPYLILGFNSKNGEISPEQISAYVSNVVTPKLYKVGGISNVLLWGEKKYAMRLWLNPVKMAQLDVTASDISSKVQANNVQSGSGPFKTRYQYIDVKPDTGMSSAQEFENMVIKQAGTHQVRLKDVAQVELGAASYNSEVNFDGKESIFGAVYTTPSANPLTVIGNVIKALPSIESSFPPGLEVHVIYNGTTFISESIKAVIQTIIEAVLIVVFVIFLFLGALRSVLIPVITIPLSLIGVAFLMYLMGFSLNLLTLLAMVLAIGLVVDDAIVVLENIYRNIEMGKSKFQAAIDGAREIAGPVIVMTLTLAAVFFPIGFLGGLTGALFTEFAFTLAAAVIVSGVIALTFSPMLCSLLINKDAMHAPMVQKVDNVFSRFRAFYERWLVASLNFRSGVLIVTAAVVLCLFVFPKMTPKQLAPQEDQGVVFAMSNGPSWANLNFMKRYSSEIGKAFATIPEQKDLFEVIGYPNNNGTFGGIILKDWSKRKRSAEEITFALQRQLKSIPGLQAFSFSMPPLPGVEPGPQVNFVLMSTDPLSELSQYANKLVGEALASGKFLFMQDDVKFDTPELQLYINRKKAASLGISMQEIAQTMSLLTAGSRLNYFTKEGYSFDVIPQVSDLYRNNPERLHQYYVRTQSGKLIPLSSIVTTKLSTKPGSLNQFDQLNAVTITGMQTPPMTLGTALTDLRGMADKILPSTISYGYKGASEQYMDEGSAMLYAFIFALIVIYLFLAAQFESFRDPFIILVSVPLSIFGALLPLFFGAGTINIYTEIGMVTLIGLITKHGILMVEFANNCQKTEGLSIRDAIHKAAAIRLRPILMTTAAMSAGVIPLMLSSGAGAAGRINLGIVIFFGMIIGTCFTLFVLPTVYTFIAKDHSKELAGPVEDNPAKA